MAVCMSAPAKKPDENLIEHLNVGCFARVYLIFRWWVKVRRIISQHVWEIVFE